VQILALRDELASRAFDLPARWWPEQPGVVGGRDRTAGGTWCASDPASAVTAVVLNRPEPRVALAGAPSRGVLPLLAVQYQTRWPEYLDIKAMAGFNLVVATPQEARWWSFDGDELRDEALAPGLSMFTPRGRLRDVDSRLLAGSARLASSDESTAEVWRDWLPVVEGVRPSSDPGALVVRKQVGHDSYETVFAQFIAARPGTLRLDYLPYPAQGGAAGWTTARWDA
jgi:hypothetical protein